MGPGRNVPVVRPSFTQLALTIDWCDVARVTIDMLLDLSILEIFKFYVDNAWMEVEAWHTLVHVCRKWRNVVFSSPQRLNRGFITQPCIP